MFKSVLVVCTGNICRSPLGAAMLREKLPGLAVESAGLHALVGKGATPEMVELAHGKGIDLSDHIARKASHDILQKFHLILVMSEEQRLEIAEHFPFALGKTMLFGQWLTDTATGKQGVEIPDPYKRSFDVFKLVYDLMERASDHWAQKLTISRI